jgi:uncharacterized membrane protein
VFVAISMVASVAALGMSLDLGRLYFTHRDLQLLADMAALDASRSAGGCLGQVDDPQGAAAGEAAGSMQRNGASLAYLTAGAVEIGRLVVVGGVRTFVLDDSERADSVRVILRRPLPARLIPLFAGPSSGVMAVSAAATLRPIVSLDVASSLADLNPDLLNQAFGDMLGNDDLSFGAGSFSGLFSANVRLGDVALEASAGSVEDFLDTQTSAPDLLNAIAAALDTSGDAALRTTLSAMASGSETSRTVLPREVLGVPAGSTADETMVNVGAFVTALAESSNGDNLVDVTVPIDLPQVLESQVRARLIEVARPAIGPPGIDAAGNPQTFANTAQAVLQAEVAFGDVLGTPIRISLSAQFANASAGLTDLHCSQRGRPQAVVTVDATSGVGGLGVGRFDIAAQTPPTFPLPAMPIVDLRPIGVPAQIVARAHGEIAGTPHHRLRFEGPYPAPPQVIGTNPGEALSAAIGDAVQDLYLNTNPPLAELGAAEQLIARRALDVVRPQVEQALQRIGRDLVAPLAEALGARTGSARIGVRSVVAQQPVIYAR